MKREVRVLMKVLCLSIVLVTLLGGVSEAAWPERPITMIYNVAAGGGGDLSSRALAQYAEKSLGVPFIVVNKVGASGALGTGLVANAKPDGYTIGQTSFGPLAQVPHVQDVPYDPLRSFDYLMGYGQFMFGILVRDDSPFKTFNDFIMYAKNNPGKIKISHYGKVSPHTLALKPIAQSQQIKWSTVIFKGSGPAMTALLGGHVDACSNIADVAMPHIKAGSVRLLASVSPERWKWVPDVPTVKELGYDVAVTSYFALGAPQGLPAPVLAKLRSVFKEAMSDPEFMKIMDNYYISAKYISPEDYQKLVEDGYKEYGKLIRELGLHKDQKK